MFLRILAVLTLLSATSGCSTYDVLAFSADVALAVFTDVNDDKEPTDDNWHSFWDPSVSRCIRVEKSRNSISQQLAAIEDGKDFVILPTGEKYPVTRWEPEESGPGPTEKCLADQSD